MNRVCKQEPCEEFDVVKACAPELDDYEVVCGGCLEPTELTDREVENAVPAN